MLKLKVRLPHASPAANRGYQQLPVSESWAARSLLGARGDRQTRFNRCPNPEYPNLSSFIANWISDYLKNYYPLVDLGVCAECGRFFERERRDKTFCSKTCQNRVAYKRKKIFESDAFAPVNVAPDDACEIEAGLWLHHPRYGIGLIEFVGNETTQ